MNFSVSHENELLLNTVRSFMEDEIYPHEEMVDRLGEVGSVDFQTAGVAGGNDA